MNAFNHIFYPHGMFFYSVWSLLDEIALAKRLGLFKVYARLGKNFNPYMYINRKLWSQTQIHSSIIFLTQSHQREKTNHLLSFLFFLPFSPSFVRRLLTWLTQNNGRQKISWCSWWPHKSFTLFALSIIGNKNFKDAASHALALSCSSFIYSIIINVHAI